MGMSLDSSIPFEAYKLAAFGRYFVDKSLLY